MYDFLWWIPLIGLCTGLIAGKKKKNGGFGILGNILIGIVGSIVGFLFFVALYDFLIFPILYSSYLYDTNIKVIYDTMWYVLIYVGALGSLEKVC